MDVRFEEEIKKKIEETEPYTFDRYSTTQMRDQGIAVPPLGWLYRGEPSTSSDRNGSLWMEKFATAT